MFAPIGNQGNRTYIIGKHGKNIGLASPKK
jgi:hypothetical protein